MFHTTDKGTPGFKRLLGAYLLLSQVPESALDEALEGLADVIEFYAQPVDSLPTTHVVNGTGHIVSTSVRPRLVMG